MPDICHFFFTYAIFGSIFLDTKVRKLLRNRFRDNIYSTCGEISDFSTSVMHINLKFLHMTNFSPHILYCLFAYFNNYKILKISPWFFFLLPTFLYLDGMLYSCVDGSSVHYINQRRPISVCKKHFLVNTISLDFISEPASYQFEMQLQLLQCKSRRLHLS